MAAAAAAAGTGCADITRKMGLSMGGLRKYTDKDFYGADGTFDAAKAKAAYYELMEHHKFPILPVLKTDEFWTLDFALGCFTEVGMGGIFYVNNEKDNYLLHDIWLLPGQMIPEHYHVKYEDVAPKMEAWLVRHGSAYFYSEGEPSPGVDERIPPSHRQCAKARHEVFKGPGEVVVQPVPEARHWMKAGPEGAIVTEVATYHSMDALRFSHPKAKV
jgi:D-lyxose ketol-isomerase